MQESFPYLNNLTISRGLLSKIDGFGSETTKLEVLRLNKLPIRNLKESFLGSLKQLKVLDLRNNSFHCLHEEKLLKLFRLESIYLSANPWNCSNNLAWIYNAKDLNNLKDINSTLCHKEPFDNKKLLYVATLKHNTSQSCPNNCSCFLTTVTFNAETNKLHPVVQVNCTKKNFISLPETLPKHTTKLVLNNNSIEDLSPLIRNSYYNDVTDLFLDYNQIRSIEVLEGTDWLRHFRILSLKGNFLTDVPTYAMTNALNQNPNVPNAVMLYLSENPWKCTCSFTPNFQKHILVEYGLLIQDLNQIKCAQVKGDPNSLQSIIQLSIQKMCHTPPAYTEKALNLLNGVLGLMILLVLGNLCYDYYSFKKTGKLPWIATKLP
nr:protein singed wings 2 isoform X2 [Onthophagus taurus]